MNNSDHIKREKLRTALATAILIVAAAAVFALVLFGLYKINMIRLPDALERLLGKPETEAPGGAVGADDVRIYSALSGEPKPSSLYALEYGVEPDALLAMLKEALPETAYKTEANVTLTDGIKSRVRMLKLSRDGAKYRAEIYENGSRTTLIVCDGTTLRHTDYSAGGKTSSRYYLTADDFSLEFLLGLPSLTDILGSGDYTDLRVTLLRAENENLYCVEYTLPDLPQKETVYVSLKNGLVVSAETYYADELVYKLSTTSFTTDVNFGAETFTVK